jgi:hypothetical protein
MAKNFDIYDYVHNNKFELKIDAPKNAKQVAKGYNDIRKTNLNEVKITDGKFSIKENLRKENRILSPEVKKHFLEIISTYNSFREAMQRKSDIQQISETLGGVVEAAREMTLAEAEDWFDAVTIKRNMGELQKLESNFDKVAKEAKALDERLHALYEDMGHILNRYYEISDIDQNVVKERLGMKEVKYPTDLQIGSVILGQGFTMLKGIEGGRYYKVVAMDDISATFVPSDKNGNVKGSTKVRHKLDSIEGGMKTAKRGDENGIVLIKK